MSVFLSTASDYSFGKFKFSLCTTNIFSNITIFRDWLLVALVIAVVYGAAMMSPSAFIEYILFTIII